MFARFVSIVIFMSAESAVLAGLSVARQWNEECLGAIRRDFPAPMVHARNLFHVSAAMYDAWAAYDPVAVGVFHNEKAEAADVAAARAEAISYAAYRVLRERYAISVGAAVTLDALDARMAALGYPIGETTTTGTSPAAVGNRCAAAVLTRAAADGSNEQELYLDNTGYQPVNEPLILAQSGTGPLADPNRWQPLAFEQALTQNGLIASNIQTFVGSHWGYVKPFALDGEFSGGVYAKFDPQDPHYLGGVGDEMFKADAVEVIRLSSLLDPALQSYHPDGLPLIPGLIELVTPETTAPGQRHEGIFIRTIAIRSWLGEPASPTEAGGVGWIRADKWEPYQQSTFVTPAFAGYVSGHSTFSRAAAEVLTAFTGSPYFPGGMGTHTVAPGALEFEFGPSSTVQLQWATYYDAADQAGISRIYGGIHFAVDDGPGRIIGSKAGKTALREAMSYMDGSVLQDFSVDLSLEETARVISWRAIPGYQYKAQWSETLDGDFQDLTNFKAYPGDEGREVDETAPATSRFYRVVRIPSP